MAQQSEWHFVCPCGNKLISTVRRAKCECGRHMEIAKPDPALYGRLIYGSITPHQFPITSPVVTSVPAVPAPVEPTISAKLEKDGGLGKGK